MTSLRSRRIPTLGAWQSGGKNRDGESLRQINIGLATRSEGDPIAFEMFPGSVSDITTLKRFAQSMNSRVPGCTLVMDRGFKSLSNAAMMMRIRIQNVLRDHDRDVLRTKAKKDSVNGMSVSELLCR